LISVVRHKTITNLLVFRYKIATIGVEDIIIIDLQDALLVCAISREQEVKTVVSQLQREGGNRWI